MNSETNSIQKDEHQKIIYSKSDEKRLSKNNYHIIPPQISQKAAEDFNLHQKTQLNTNNLHRAVHTHTAQNTLHIPVQRQHEGSDKFVDT